MSDNVKYKNWQCHDDRPAICREEAARRALAFAGIHDIEAETEIDEAFGGGLGNWEGAEGTWAIAGGTLQGTGGGAAQWYKIRHVTEIDPGFVATFDKTGNRGMFIFCSDDSYNGYFFAWSGTAVSMGDLTAALATNVVVLPCAEAGDASVKIMMWPQSYTSVDEIDDITCAMWFDDKLLLVHTVPYDSSLGKKVGFGVYESDVITFDDLQVPQFHQITEWTSVDPGEAASAGLSRVIAHARVRVQARYDGTVKIWRNDTITSDWTVQDWRPLRVDERQQIFWPTHMRMAGAMHEADVFRDDNQGHIFVIGQDPNVLIEEATNEVAVLTHREMEEKAHSLGLGMAPNPVIEPEDVITYDGNKWRVSTISYRVGWRGGQEQGAPVLESQMQLRECIAKGFGAA